MNRELQKEKFHFFSSMKIFLTGEVPRIFSDIQKKKIGRKVWHFFLKMSAEVGSEQSHSTQCPSRGEHKGQNQQKRVSILAQTIIHSLTIQPTLLSADLHPLSSSSLVPHFQVFSGTQVLTVA